MLSPVNVDYDPSNGTYNIWCLEIARLTQKAAEVWQLQPYWFTTHGHAMAFMSEEIEEGSWKQDSGLWVADLKNGNNYGGYAVRVQQLILMEFSR